MSQIAKRFTAALKAALLLASFLCFGRLMPAPPASASLALDVAADGVTPIHHLFYYSIIR
jgi:hypothetical protein